MGAADVRIGADAAGFSDRRSRLKVSYLHGRPGPHPMQGRFAAAVGGEFSFVDFRMRWQDRKRPRLYVMASWLLCAATLPHKRAYNVFLVDNLHIGPVVMKRWFLRGDQKVVVHLGSHTMYFLLTHRFNRWVERLHEWALRGYDALICEGQMTVDMVHLVLGDGHPPIYEVYGGVDDERALALMPVQPNLEARRLVFLGSGPGEFRMHYKGLDLMIEAFGILAARDHVIEFDVVGDWDEPLIEALLKRLPAADRERVHFLGAINTTSQVAAVLSRSALYLHCSRGDAFPGATIEAMTAGLVPLVSEWTGTKELAAQVSDQLVTKLDAVEIAERMAWYFALSTDERRRLSDRSREVAAPYRATLAIRNYQAVFRRIGDDLCVTHPEVGAT